MTDIVGSRVRMATRLTLAWLVLLVLMLGFCVIAGLALMWLTLVCLVGRGGMVNSFLSSSLWLPLSRLTYCAYLVHPIVLTTYYAGFQAPLYYTDETAIYAFLGNLVVAYACAALLACTVEFPLSEVERICFGGGASRPDRSS